MADVLTPDQRRRCMAAIRSTGNKSTELAIMRTFRRLRISGWRRGVVLRFAYQKIRRRIHPDFVFRDKRVALFVDGEFWHGHPTKCRIPITRRDWWIAKIEQNKRRDRLQNRLLRQAGWKVVRIWQHEIGTSSCLRKLRRAGLL